MAEQEEEKRIQHYSSNHQILLVGDGDFSFSLCLAENFRPALNIVASSLQSYDEVIKMYKNGKSNLEKLKALKATIFHGVDATEMEDHHDLRNMKFDRIIFNFPHAGFFDEKKEHTIQKHKDLVGKFFGNAKQMLQINGEIHVNHKMTHPFNQWDLPGLASQNSLKCVACPAFIIENYPGYNNKYGAGPKGDSSFPLGECLTYKFILDPSRNMMQRKKQKINHNLQKQFQKFQGIPNFMTSPIFSPLPGSGGRIISPTYINGMIGFSGNTSLPARHVPRNDSERIINGHFNEIKEKYQGIPTTSQIFSGLPISSGNRNCPTYANGMNGFSSNASLPARHGPRSDIFGIFNGHFNEIKENFGREDIRVEDSVRLTRRQQQQQHTE